ncbi:hypothetical protein LJR074_001931 [Acidovorax sp. LjRoot74]|uniref:hypothetical protein n=1 Tax=Acidovorax sp. LjRoot74 TaxID=3342337 RepID=UPI003ECFAB7C
MASPFPSLPSARELRRLQGRNERRGIKPPSDRHEVINPVTEAVIRSRIEADIQRLRTDTGLQAYLGDDAARIASMAGRLVYIVCHAAGVHGLGETPEGRILAGTANALADIAGTPAELERQRGAVIAGLQAIDRLMPQLHTLSLAAGALELDNLLATTAGMSTADVHRALGIDIAPKFIAASA